MRSADADLARQTAGAGADLGHLESLLLLVLRHYLDEVAEMLGVESPSQGVSGVQRVMLLMLCDCLDGILRRKEMSINPSETESHPGNLCYA